MGEEAEFDDEDDDMIAFAPEDGQDACGLDPELGGGPRWSILMVDDDEHVHRSTMLALGEESVLGRHLSFRHAYSAKEALEMIEWASAPPDVAFVDMVMESSDAGLRFAKAAKADPRWAGVRILLRSGQPASSDEMIQARGLGVEGFAQKAGINRSILIEALAELLSGRGYFME